jgi:hypothetical protein
VRCRVTRDGQGLAGVTVTLRPEPFMGNALKPATGVSGADGTVPLRVSPDLPGLSPGFYRIEASLIKDGTETLPSRYNVQSGLGQEVAPALREEILVRLGR